MPEGTFDHGPSTSIGLQAGVYDPRGDRRPEVLAVDDDPIIHESLRRLSRQENHGFRYRFAATCDEAMTALAQRRSDVLLADYMLEDGFGTDLVPFAGVPVVVMTGYGSEAVAVEALRAGAYDYLIKDQQGSFVGLIEATLERALARHRAELGMQQREAELQDSRRANRALEQFASLIANALSTPLQVVSHYCGLMLSHRPIENDRLAQSYATAAFGGARRASRLITDVLEYSRIGAPGGAFGPVDLAAAVDDALLDLRAAVLPPESSISVEPLPWVMGDRVQLRTLLRRLLQRAVGRCKAASNPIIVGVRGSCRGAEAIVQIEDCGLAELESRSEGENPWDEAVGEAQSLDLAIARRVVERHAGRLWLGAGSGGRRFVAFALPAAPVDFESVEEAT